MSKIYFFGTRSGTEPMEGMHHTCIVIETGGMYYFFDAGENCTDSSHLAGVDHLKIKSIFISHPHIDHIGGLAGLIGNVHKLTTLSQRRPADRKIDLFIPNLATWEGFYTVLLNCSDNYFSEFEVKPHRIADGVIFEDDNIKVTAFHNHHIQAEEGNGWLSYSFLIEAEGKRIVFSGDVRDMYDLDNVIGDGCDIAMIETGHHKVSAVGEYAESKNIGKLIFTHHGREIINDRPAAQAKADALTIPAVIAYDGMVEEV
ncbi:MAG: MBL fold metallo-hydrolase [Clostridia bacterium]|nr:MBL fold metallo-hydrolase [Clostridia bacterium]